MGKVIAAGVFLVNKKKNEVLICHPNKPFNESGVYTKVKVEVN
jgi:hypothetical protein